MCSSFYYISNYSAHTRDMSLVVNTIIKRMEIMHEISCQLSVYRSNSFKHFDWELVCTIRSLCILLCINLKT